MAVAWFRRDLRLSDNPALLDALTVGNDVVALFVLDDALWRPAGPTRRAFLAGCLGSLDESTGGHLVVRIGDPAQVVPQLTAEVGASTVHAAEDFGPYGRRRDRVVARALAATGAELALVGSAYAVAPGSLSTRQGSPYRVFGPFARAWQEHGWEPPAPAPGSPSWVDGLRSDGLPELPRAAADLPPAGEEAAKRAVRRFWERQLDGYDELRNIPAADVTSRLSPYLRWGCLHPRQLLAKLGTDRSSRRFRDELCWREFYADVLLRDPASARRSWQPGMRSLRVDEGALADDRFAAWSQGRTGFPLVDAGMRQLAAEAWMHNRVRMVVASFLVKDLHLDWSRGARWFMQHLVDGDLASNSHGWQWVAGTGTDPSPFVRVFNPVAQSKRFDPDGDYIRRWLPELRAVPAPAIHEPWTLTGGPPAGYSMPIVDHATERREALVRYGELP
ncbi:MAG TPA: deoxyribodipyrimidine photo-lyase [Microthrixaceae bacterium]|nr:deoxyribodipyrimidine photo-lyase [Microthrixaceae bacterium]